MRRLSNARTLKSIRCSLVFRLYFTQTVTGVAAELERQNGFFCIQNLYKPRSATSETNQRIHFLSAVDKNKRTFLNKCGDVQIRTYFLINAKGCTSLSRYELR